MAINTESLVDYAYSLYRANANQGSCEVELRTAINRAYYGAFLTARDHARIQNSGGSVHREVADHYSAQNIGLISNNLNSLKRLRQKADYRPDTKIEVREARNSCRTARTIVAEVSKLGGGP